MRLCLRTPTFTKYLHFQTSAYSRTTVTIFYETHCPDSQKFMVNQVSLMKINGMLTTMITSLPNSREDTRNDFR